jgi:hypothetical protein
MAECHLGFATAKGVAILIIGAVEEVRERRATSDRVKTRSRVTIFHLPDKGLEREREGPKGWDIILQQSCHWIYPRIRSSTLRVIRCTRSSGPCGRPWCEIGGMWPGGADSPCDQKIVEALNTRFFFGPG